MASKVEIWNLALAHIGHGRVLIADPDERTAEANYCRVFYPTALRVALEQFAWSFATTRVALSEVTNPVDHWAFAYALPNQCIKPRAVLFPGSTDDSKEQPFAVETTTGGVSILYTNVEDAVLKYTMLVENTVRFSPLFVLALSYDLASMLVGPIPKDGKMKKSMMDAALYHIGMAEASDAALVMDTSYQDFIPSHMQGR